MSPVLLTVKEINVRMSFLFCTGDVFVTAIKYVRQTSSLLVGLNFGCFQMWNMETLTLM